MANRIADDRAGRFPFWRRSIVVLVVTSVAGPLLGALALPMVDVIATLATGRVPLPDRFMDELRSALGLSLIVGVPFAVAAGAVLAWIVAKQGTVSYRTCALVAFLVPCVLSFPVLGGLFVLAPLIGLVAAFIAVIVRASVAWIALRSDGKMA